MHAISFPNLQKVNKPHIPKAALSHLDILFPGVLGGEIFKSKFSLSPGTVNWLIAAVTLRGYWASASKISWSEALKSRHNIWPIPTPTTLSKVPHPLTWAIASSFFASPSSLIVPHSAARQTFEKCKSDHGTPQAALFSDLPQTFRYIRSSTGSHPACSSSHSPLSSSMLDNFQVPKWNILLLDSEPLHMLFLISSFPSSLGV